jgi:hypothetical protein
MDVTARGSPAETGSLEVWYYNLLGVEFTQRNSPGKQLIVILTFEF